MILRLILQFPLHFFFLLYFENLRKLTLNFNVMLKRWILSSANKKKNAKHLHISNIRLKNTQVMMRCVTAKFTGISVCNQSEKVSALPFDQRVDRVMEGHHQLARTPNSLNDVDFCFQSYRRLVCLKVFLYCKLKFKNNSQEMAVPVIYRLSYQNWSMISSKAGDRMNAFADSTANHLLSVMIIL